MTTFVAVVVIDMQPLFWHGVEKMLGDFDAHIGVTPAQRKLAARSSSLTEKLITPQKKVLEALLDADIGAGVFFTEYVVPGKAELALAPERHGLWQQESRGQRGHYASLHDAVVASAEEAAARAGSIECDPRTLVFGIMEPLAGFLRQGQELVCQKKTPARVRVARKQTFSALAPSGSELPAQLDEFFRAAEFARAAERKLVPLRVVESSVADPWHEQRSQV